MSEDTFDDLTSSPLDPRKTFATFIVGKSNKDAFDAARAASLIRRTDDPCDQHPRGLVAALVPRPRRLNPWQKRLLRKAKKGNAK